MRKWCGLVLALACLWSPRLAAWGLTGHVVISRAAINALPADVPAVEALLSAAGLPLDGAADALSRGVVVRDGTSRQRHYLYTELAGRTVD